MLVPDGAPVRLVGLSGELAMYNGQVTHPRKIDNDPRFLDGYIVIVNKEIMNTMGRVTEVEPRQLVVQAKHCHVIDTSISEKREKAQNIAYNTTGYGANTNLGVKDSLMMLTSLIRAAMKQYSKKGSKDPMSGIRQVFGQFDTNKSGKIDQDEFTIGCSALGIPITREDAEMLFPIFDGDNSSEIDLVEFMEFVRKAGAGHSGFRAHRKLMMKQAVDYTKTNREKDIRSKTEAPRILAGLMNLLVKKAQEFMDSHADMTENHLFSLIDMDGNGGLSMVEFIDGLQRYDIAVAPSVEETNSVVEVIWPMFKLDEASELTAQAWHSFLSLGGWTAAMTMPKNKGNAMRPGNRALYASPGMRRKIVALEYLLKLPSEQNESIKRQPHWTQLGSKRSSLENGSLRVIRKRAGTHTHFVDDEFETDGGHSSGLPRPLLGIMTQVHGHKKTRKLLSTRLTSTVRENLPVPPKPPPSPSPTPTKTKVAREKIPCPPAEPKQPEQVEHEHRVLQQEMPRLPRLNVPQLQMFVQALQPVGRPRSRPSSRPFQRNRKASITIAYENRPRSTTPMCIQSSHAPLEKRSPLSLPPQHAGAGHLRPSSASTIEKRVTQLKVAMKNEHLPCKPVACNAATAVLYGQSLLASLPAVPPLHGSYLRPPSSLKAPPSKKYNQRTVLRSLERDRRQRKKSRKNARNGAKKTAACPLES